MMMPVPLNSASSTPAGRLALRARLQATSDQVGRRQESHKLTVSQMASRILTGEWSHRSTQPWSLQRSPCGGVASLASGMSKPEHFREETIPVDTSSENKWSSMCTGVALETHHLTPEHSKHPPYTSWVIESVGTAQLAPPRLSLCPGRKQQQSSTC